ncbi:hypothetical protein AS27_06081, partial [Aptenodytes forsteri]
GFSQPHVSVCTHMAVLLQCYFFFFVRYVSLIEEKGERLGLSCFCTVILTIRGRCKGMLNPGDGSQQTSDRSYLI